MKITYSHSAWKVIHDRDKQPWPKGVATTEYLFGDPTMVSIFNHELKKEEKAKLTIISEILD